VAVAVALVAVALLPVSLAPSPAGAAVGDLTTVAGSTTGGYLGDCGPAVDAQLPGVRHLAFDLLDPGPMAIAIDDHRVALLEDGEVRVIAGDGTASSTGSGGPAALASLNDPSGIGINRGWVYVAERGSHRVRRIDLASGTIDEFAGDGTAGTAAGPSALAASIPSPGPIAVEPRWGSTYIADIDPTQPLESAGRIRKVLHPTGTISTVVSGLEAPVRGLAVDWGGSHLYYADDAGTQIMRYRTSDGLITKVAGTGTKGFSGDGGPATEAAVDEPRGMVVSGDDDDSALLYADGANNRLRRVDLTSGTISTVAGNGAIGASGDGGPPAAAELGDPTAVAVDGTGAWFVAQVNPDRVRTLDAGRIVTAVNAGGGGSLLGVCLPAHQARFQSPEGTAVDADGNLYVADRMNHRVRRIDAATGWVRTVAGTGTAGYGGDGGPATAATLNNPRDLAFDHAGGLLVLDSANARIRRIDPVTGVITTVVGSGTAGFSGDGGPAVNAQIRIANEMVVDPAGRLVLADTVNHRIRRIALDGTITTIAGTGTAASTGDGGAATAAGIPFPWGVTVDPAGNVFVSERDGHRVRRIDAATGVVTTVIGDGVAASSGDGGLATGARVSSPRGLHADTAGALFVADQGGHRLRRIDPTTGTVSTVAGNGALSPIGDGPAVAVALASPGRVDAGSTPGDLLVVHTNRIRRLEGVNPVGALRATTDPAVPAVISVNGIARDSWGLTWLELPTGTHEVCFAAVAGFAPPPCEDVVVPPGGTGTIAGTYQPRGYLQVATSPALPSTITVDGVPRNDWGLWTEVDPGTYEVCWGTVAGHQAPPCESVVVPAGVTKSVTGVFTDKPEEPGPTGHGLLRVTTDPPVASRITIDGQWADSWGLTWVKLAPATYEVCFEPVLHATTPLCKDVEVTAGQTSSLVGEFVPHGFLQVSTDPPVPATLYVDGRRTNAYGVFTSREPGTHHVCFGPAPGSGLVPPPCQTVEVVAGQTTSVTGTYE
jgi:sugar lactone lactonase YvrE